MPFRIAQDIQPKQQVAVPIHHPADPSVPTAITITLHGRYTAGWRAAQAAYRAQVGAQPVAEDAVLADTMRPFLVHATAAWDGVTDEAGDAVRCTAETVAALYAEVPWLYEQVWAAFLDVARFFGSATTSSSPTPSTSSPSSAS